jgi:hypothetical protein
VLCAEEFFALEPCTVRNMLVDELPMLHRVSCGLFAAEMAVSAPSSNAICCAAEQEARLSAFGVSIGGMSPSASLKRDRLLQRNAILRRTGFIEADGKIRGSIAGAALECPLCACMHALLLLWSTVHSPGLFLSPHHSASVSRVSACLCA